MAMLQLHKMIEKLRQIALEQPNTDDMIFVTLFTNTEYVNSFFQ